MKLHCYIVIILYILYSKFIFIFIIYYLLSIIYYLLSIIYYLLFIIYYLLFVCFDTHMWYEYKRKLLGIPTIASHMMLLRYDN